MVATDNLTSSASSPGYFTSNYTGTEQTVLAIVLILIIIFSLFGNGGMLIVLYKNDRMWNSTNILIGNLAVVAVLTTMFIVPFNLTSMMLRKWPFGEGPICKFNAFLTSQLLLYTIFIHTMLSIDKYYAVVKPLSRAMTVRRTWVSSFVLWTVATFMSLGPLIHIGAYEYNRTALVCGVGFPKNKLDSIYMLILFAIGFIIPNIVNAIVYFRVFTAVRQHTKRIQKTSVSSSYDVIKLQHRLVLTTFSSLLCFLLCWTPFAIYVGKAITSKSIASIPHGLGVSAYWSGYLYNAVNPLIICSMSSRYGNGIYEITMKVLRAPITLFERSFRMKSLERNDVEESNTATVHPMQSFMTTKTISSNPVHLSTSSASSSSFSSNVMTSSTAEVNLIPKSPMEENHITHETRVISSTYINLSIKK